MELIEDGERHQVLFNLNRRELRVDAEALADHPAEVLEAIADVAFNVGTLAKGGAA